MTDVFISLTVLITSHRKRISKHQALYLKYIYFLCQLYLKTIEKKKRQTKNKKPCALAASLASLYYQPC